MHILPDEGVELDDENLAMLVCEHLNTIGMPIADGFRISMTIKNNWKEYKVLQ